MRQYDYHNDSMPLHSRACHLLPISPEGNCASFRYETVVSSCSNSYSANTNPGIGGLHLILQSYWFTFNANVTLCWVAPWTGCRLDALCWDHEAMTTCYCGRLVWFYNRRTVRSFYFGSAWNDPTVFQVCIFSSPLAIFSFFLHFAILHHQMKSPVTV